MAAEEGFVETVYHYWTRFDVMEDYRRDDSSCSDVNTKKCTLNPYVRWGINVVLKFLLSLKEEKIIIIMPFLKNITGFMKIWLL